MVIVICPDSEQPPICLQYTQVDREGRDIGILDSDGCHSRDQDNPSMATLILIRLSNYPQNEPSDTSNGKCPGNDAVRD